ncbi:MAG: elongation factor G [Planctomycetota bacterium]|nr:elongation factor G [Planctomycetota bacterium]MDA1162430.1 elongation factor G [Planctomycetota bacterium]
MTDYRTKDIRNIALVGHGHSGKTTLADLLLFKAGENSRAGSVDDGSSLLDTDEEEKERKSSITSSVCHLTHHGKRINIVDTPGYPDFLGQVAGALEAVETAAIIVNASAGIEVNTRRTFEMAGEFGLGRIIILNRLGQENIDFDRDLAELQDVFGSHCIPINVPNSVGRGFSSVVKVLEPTGPGVVDPASFTDELRDCIVEADDELMERYMETLELTPNEFRAGIPKAVAAGTLIPIFCVSGKRDIGVNELLDGIADLCPSPDDIQRRTEDGTAIIPDPSGPLLAQVFKTRIDPFVAKMNYVRVFSGTLKRDTVVNDVSTQQAVKIGALNEIQGSNLRAVLEAIPGDIVAAVKVDGLHTSDSLGDRSMKPIAFPKPMVGWAVEPMTSADQQKLSGALAKIVEEDQTFSITREEQTHEMVVHGMSELHLQILMDRVQKRDRVNIKHHTPKIPYRETCIGEAEGFYRHKKQSGGSGQFAEVHMKVYPLPRDINPEEYFTKARFDHLREYHYDPEFNFAFLDCVSGGSVPNQFIPAVEKGVRDRMTKGVLAGFHVQDCVAVLHFGKDHPVDSNETAFKMAASICFREVFMKSRPVLLEPIVHIEITIPAEYLGDITSDLTTRRGRMEGMDAASGGYTVVKGCAPLSEIQDYARQLSSISGGQGSYSIEQSHYEVVPANEQPRIIAAAKHVEEEDH